MSHEFTPGELKRLYSEYYPRSSFELADFKAAKLARGFSAWLNGERRCAYSWVPPFVRVLDIGCGFGGTLAYHQGRGSEVYGVEADENIRRVAEKFGFNVHVGLFDPELYEPNFFDYVTLDQVIEHVADPIETLRGIVRILKPGGVAILSTPNANGWGASVFGRRWINWHAPYHLQYFSRKSIVIAAESAGMSVERVRTITCSQWLHYQWNHLLTFPRMGEPSSFWAPRGAQGLKEKCAMLALILMHSTKLNHIVTRFFDSLGEGDNFLFFLRKP